MTLVALVAGGTPPVALALGLSMTCLQFAIGAVNDLVDAAADAGRKPGKPIPARLVTPAQARLVAALSAAAGLVLALAIGPGLLVLAGVALAIGLAYDLWAKGTTVSWLPLAIGVPLLPVYGWFGATGELPGLFLVLIPAAANAGAALAVANALVDVERDEAAGARSIAVALGPWTASRLVVALQGVVVALAVATAAVVGAPVGWVAAVLAASVVPLGGAALGVVAATREGTGPRELAFEVQAVGTGLLAVAWLAALGASPGAGAA